MKPANLTTKYWKPPATGRLDRNPRQDARFAYRDYRRLLVLLSGGDPRRLVLKDPFHAMSLPALYAAIPDARVVMTHRALAEVVPSLHKLGLTTQAVLCRTLDVPRIVEASTAWLAWVAERIVEDRARTPHVVDVDYRALVADPVGTARHIHDAFGLGWDDALEARLRAFVAANGQRRHGENPYSTEAFGQTPAEVDARFRAYRERFLMSEAA
jgi:hypothetical protein